MTTGQAIAHLSEALKDPSYYQSWQANIAMAFKDNWHWHFKENKPDVPFEDLHAVSNKAADYFLSLLMGKPQGET